MFDSAQPTTAACRGEEQGDDRSTNSHRLPPNSEFYPAPQSEDVGVGIDTVRVSGSLTRWPDMSRLDSVHVEQGSGLKREAGGRKQISPGVHMKVDRRDGQPMAAIEFSVPKYLHAHNLKLASVAEAKEAVLAMYERAGQFVEWNVEVDALSLMRVDATLDFISPSKGVTSVLFDGLRQLPSPHRPATDVYRDQDGLITVKRSSLRRWSVTLYDKQEELMSCAAGVRDPRQRARLEALAGEAANVIRCEVMARSPVLKEREMKQLTELTSGTVTQLHHHYVNWARFDATVGSEGWIQSFADAAESDRKSIMHLLGMYHLQAKSLAVPLSANTIAKHEAVAERLGLKRHDLLCAQSDFAVRLDYPSRSIVTIGPQEPLGLQVA